MIHSGDEKKPFGFILITQATGAASADAHPAAARRPAATGLERSDQRHFSMRRPVVTACRCEADPSQLAAVAADPRGSARICGDIAVTLVRAAPCSAQ